MAPSGPATVTTVRAVKARKFQAWFRKEIVARDERCVITGLSANVYLASKSSRRTMVTAAHIKPCRLCADTEYYDLDNGLLLVSYLHTAFDQALWTIDPDTSRVVTAFGQLEDIDGDFVKLTEGQLKYLRGHYEWTTENWVRWNT